MSYGDKSVSNALEAKIVNGDIVVNGTSVGVADTCIHATNRMYDTITTGTTSNSLSSSETIAGYYGTLCDGVSSSALKVDNKGNLAYVSKLTERVTDKNSKTSLMKEWITESGTVSRSQVLIPKITNVEVFNNRVVKVTFSDGTFTKSVCQKDDVFNLELGLLLCLIEKREKDGRSDYLKMLKYALRRRDEIARDKQKALDEEKERKAMIKRRHEKYLRKKARREERSRVAEKSSTKKKSNGNNRKDSK